MRGRYNPDHRPRRGREEKEKGERAEQKERLTDLQEDLRKVERDIAKIDFKQPSELSGNQHARLASLRDRKEALKREIGRMGFELASSGEQERIMREVVDLRLEEEKAWEEKEAYKDSEDKDHIKSRDLKLDFLRRQIAYTNAFEALPEEAQESVRRMIISEWEQNEEE